MTDRPTPPARWLLPTVCSPGIAPATPAAATVEALLRHTWRTRLGGQPLALSGEALAWHQRSDGGASTGSLRLNELQLSAERGAWAFSAGKKVLGWDVGFGFRPNDVVQQEARRSLVARPLEGRPLLQVDHFGDDSATTLVWAQPQHLHHSLADSPGAEESALALRHYQRSGAVDWHGFARLGRHTGASLGAALAWVATDSVAVHASLRQLQRHTAWAGLPDPAGTLARQDPWQRTLAGAATQALVGLQWTGEARHSLLLEAWHDGTAPAAGAWRAWGAHQAALLASPAPAAARAGNLAWQATPFDQTSLHRNNLFARWSWQPDQPPRGSWRWMCCGTRPMAGAAPPPACSGRATACASTPRCASWAGRPMRCWPSCRSAAPPCWRPPGRSDRGTSSDATPRKPQCRHAVLRPADPADACVRQPHVAPMAAGATAHAGLRGALHQRGAVPHAAAA
jgi:hypothetical protein